ncbi:MAG: Hsp33 family molecular chaperone HslO [Croceibacterium sp.]
MTTPEKTPAANHFDRLLSFTLPGRHARGRIVRLGPVLNRILAAHDYPAGIKQLLAEALVLTSLMGGLLKRDTSQLTLQAQAPDGIVRLLVCDYRDGELRGYVQFDEDRHGTLGSDASLAEVFGSGYLAVTFDLPVTDERYQGIVQLTGTSLSAAVEAYFAQSEQVPTLIRTSVTVRANSCSAGGLLIQHMAEGEEGQERLHARAEHPEWDHVAILARSVQDGELVDPALPLDTLVWRLFHEEPEVRVQPSTVITRGCRCSLVHFEEVLARFPKEDRREMQDENGVILVDCAFCSREFAIQD